MEFAAIPVTRGISADARRAAVQGRVQCRGPGCRREGCGAKGRVEWRGLLVGVGGRINLGSGFGVLLLHVRDREIIGGLAVSAGSPEGKSG